MAGYLDDFQEYKRLALPLETIQTISAASVLQIYNSQRVGKDFQILDVRGHGEWRGAHIQAADFLCLDTLNRNCNTVVNKEDKPVFVHCRGGLRSLIAISYLKSKNYKNLFNIVGGFGSLSKLDFKIVKNKN